MDRIVDSRNTYTNIAAYARRTINLLAASPHLIKPSSYSDLMLTLTMVVMAAEHVATELENATNGQDTETQS